MGKLIVYTGPMRSGKTTKLIEEYEKVVKSHPGTAMFKAQIDNRFNKYRVVARNKSEQVDAILINNINDLLYYKNYNNFFIDEFQFLEGDVEAIVKLLDEGKSVWVSGLNLTSERRPFGRMADLMCYANKIYVLKSKCDFCGCKRGVFTIYLSSGECGECDEGKAR